MLFFRGRTAFPETRMGPISPHKLQHFFATQYSTERRGGVMHRTPPEKSNLGHPVASFSRPR